MGSLDGWGWRRLVWGWFGLFLMTFVSRGLNAGNSFWAALVTGAGRGISRSDFHVSATGFGQAWAKEVYAHGGHFGALASTGMGGG